MLKKVFSISRGKGILYLLALAAFTTGMVGAIMHQRATRYPKIDTEGINELRLRLEIPGGGENPGDFVIRNSGEHTVVGYRVVYEGHTISGEVHEWSTLMVQPLAFPSNAERKPEYLTPQYGCIPPGAAVFGGLNREPEPQDGINIPRPKRVWVPGSGLEYYDRIVVRLDAVMLDDGRVHGRDKGALIGKFRQTFKEEMDEFLAPPAGYETTNGGDDANQ